MRRVLVLLLSAALAMVVACGVSGVSDPSGSEAGSGSDAGGTSPAGGSGGGSGGDVPADGGDTSGAGDGASGGGVIIAAGEGGGSESSSEENSGGGSAADAASGSSGGGSTDSGSVGGGLPVIGLPAKVSAGAESSTVATPVTGSSAPGSSSSVGGVSIPAQTERLQIVNRCAYTIWIQQQNMPAGTPSVIELASSGSTQWVIPAVGLAATRLWPKKGCDAGGNNCLMGQSSAPCPASGCPPPVDSKFEATWACTLSDVNQCAPNPSAPWQKLSDNTYWNTSAVDGYTFPFTATVTDNTLPESICSPVDCSGLTMDQCPLGENLSVGMGGAVNALYSSLDLRLRNGAGDLMGCYAPCTALTYPTYGGFGLSNTGTEAAMYCCPTPPVSPSQCSSGPVETTHYVSRVRTMCGGTVYTYAYDDGNGLRQCSAATKVRLIIGPNCP